MLRMNATRLPVIRLWVIHRFAVEQRSKAEDEDSRMTFVFRGTAY